MKILKNISALLLSILLMNFSAGILYSDTGRENNILNDMSILEQYYPCSENSENEKKVFSYIQERLDSMEIEYYRENLDMLPDIHSFSSNIIADFKGKKDKTLIIAAPVNNLSSSAFNIAMMLSLAEELNSEPSDINCMQIFLGAEYTTADETGYPIGSRQFLSTFFPENDTAIIYIDLRPDAGIDIIHGSREKVTPLWLLSGIINTFTEKGTDFRINTQENILYQLGYDTPTPADIYLDSNIPSISLLSTEEKASGSNNSGKIRDSFSNIIRNLDIESSEKWDSHYLIIQAAGRNIILSEFTIIIFYLSALAVIIAFSVFSGKKVIRYSGKLVKYIWVLFYFFFLIFIFLLLSTFITIFITQIKSSYDIWKETPFYLLVLKISIASLLFFLSLFLLKKIKIPMSGSFYSASAILIFLVNLSIFQFININLALFALWGLFWTIIFSLFKSRIIKTACMMLSSVYIIYILIYAFFKPAINICESILFDKITGNILTSFILLPYIMMIIRILISRTHIESQKYTALRRSIYTATALLFIFLLNFYMKNNPFHDRNIQPVYFSQINDLNRKTAEVIIKSPYRTGKISFFTGGKEYETDSGQTEIRETAETDMELLEIKKKTSSFLDRKNLLLEITAAGDPEKYYIDFFTKEDPVILDCNYPVSVLKKNRMGSIHIGKNPPSPLTVDILVPEKTSIWFRIRTVSDRFPFDNRLTGNNMNFIQHFEIIKGTDG